MPYLCDIDLIHHYQHGLTKYSSIHLTDVVIIIVTFVVLIIDVVLLMIVDVVASSVVLIIFLSDVIIVSVEKTRENDTIDQSTLYCFMLAFHWHRIVSHPTHCIALNCILSYRFD